jgi:hypothetical protein
METLLYRPGSPAATVQQPENRSEKARPAKGPMMIEKVFFGITRIFVGGLAVLVLLGLLSLGVGFVLTLRSDQQERVVTYDEVSLSFMPDAGVPRGAKTSRKASGDEVKIPQIVEESVSDRRELLEWLDTMDRREQSRFLANLAEVIEKAKTAGVGRAKMDIVVSRFKQIWDQRSLSARTQAWEKMGERTAFVSAAFGGLMILTLLTMVLVLLAVERNTRAKKES